ncbi:MAG TPA: hypothetical protein VLA89_19550 [Gemmatimonadales bacterium]|nr:hypothetical protein [Gemmatimonadales bacterium]
MKQTHVVVNYKPWRGEQWVDPEDAWVLVCSGYEINGHHVHDGTANLVVDGAIFTIRLQVPDYSDPAYDDYRESNIAHAEKCIAAIREELTEEDWLEETTEDVLVLPVSSIEMRQHVREKELV